jgi:O-antigen/teichoic acid export membrane protein
MNGNNQNIKTYKLSNNESFKFTRDVFWVAASQVFTTLLAIVILPALTKSYSTATYGIWVQVSVTVGLISPLLTLQLGSAIVRFLAGEEDKAKRRRYFSSMLGAIIIFACLIFTVLMLMEAQVSVFLFASPTYIIFVRLTFLWTFVDALFGFFLCYLRARDKIRILSIILAVFSAAKIVLIVALASAGFKLEWLISCMVTVEAIFVIAVFSMIIGDMGLPKPSLAGLKVFLAFSVPQIPSGVLMWIVGVSDRYFITHFLSLSQTSIYSTSDTLGGLIALFFSPISFVLLPVVSRLWENKRTADVRIYLEYSTRLFLTLAIPAAFGLALLSQPLLKILTTSQYLAGSELVLLVAFGTIFLGIYEINMYIILLVQQTKWLPLMILGATVISVGINTTLIPRIGIIGGAIATIASYFVLAVIVTFWARKAISYRFDLKFLGKVIGASLVMALCFYFLKVNGVLEIIVVIIGGMVIYGCALLIMRAFSEQDKRLVKQTLNGIIPWLH